jgi:hypothetical protein
VIDPHRMARAQARVAVLIATTVIVDDALKTVDQVVQELEALHHDPLTAERLVFLVPLAFGRVALKAKGLERFPWTARIDTDSGEVLDLDLQADPIFIEGLRYAVESYEGNGVGAEGAERIAADSPEVSAARRAEEAGQDLKQARLHEGVWRSRLAAADWSALSQVSPSPAR